jgi:hypothetical protein
MINRPPWMFLTILLSVFFLFLFAVLYILAWGALLIFDTNGLYGLLSLLGSPPSV